MTGSSTTTYGVPDWVSEAGKYIYGQGKNLFETPYKPPPTADERVAPFTADQNSAFSMLRDYVSSGGGDNGKLFTKGADLVSDPGSGLNPYTDAVLRPQIRNINEASTDARMRLGDQAIAAGAFGDARHGVLEGQNDRDTMLAIGDATGRAYNDAWNEASTRGMNLIGASSTGQNDFMTRLNALLGTGGIQQQNDQSKRDVGYQNYLAEQQNPYDKLAMLISTLGGVPYQKTATQTEQPGFGSLFSLLGSLLGAFR